MSLLSTNEFWSRWICSLYCLICSATLRTLQMQSISFKVTRKMRSTPLGSTDFVLICSGWWCRATTSINCKHWVTQHRLRLALQATVSCLYDPPSAFSNAAALGIAARQLDITLTSSKWVASLPAGQLHWQCWAHQPIPFGIGWSREGCGCPQNIRAYPCRRKVLSGNRCAAG